MANLTAEQYDTLQEMLKVITEARQTSERLSESWAKGLANPIGPHTTHLSSPITPMTPSQSPQPPDPPDLVLVDPGAAKMVDTITQSLIDVNKQLQKQSEESAAWRAEIDEQFMDIKNVRADPLPRESSVTLISYPTPTKPPQPPDPPDFNQFGQRLSKFEFPKFDGTLLREWFRRCEEFFYLHKTPPEMRVRVASSYMIGKALQWHTDYIRSNFGIFPPWLDYIMAISAKFGDDDAIPMHPVPFNPYYKNPYATPLLPAIQPRAPFSPYQNQNNQSHYKIPNTTSLLPPLETTKALPYKPYLPTEINMENSPRKLSHEEIQESEMRVWCESSDGSYANGHHLESKKSQVFVKGCEVASMSGDEANYKTNSVLEKETFPSSELCQRIPVTQPQSNNVTQQEEVPILSLEPSQFDVTTIADDVWIAKRCESSLLQHSSATKGRAPFSPYQNYSNQQRRFGKCPEIEFDRNSDEIKDEKLQGKQPEEDVKTLVISENEQFLECDDEESFNVEKSGEITAEGTAIELLGKSGYKVFKEGYLDSLLLQEVHMVLLHFKESSEDAINHLKKLLAIMGGLAQKISCGLLCGDSKFHLKHKWKSRLIQALSGLQFGVDNILLFTSPDKMLFSNNHKLLHPETGFCTQYNDLELLNTEHQTSPGLDYFTYLNFIWKQVLNCGCEASHVSSRIFSIGGVHGLEAQRMRLLVLNEISLLENYIKVDFTIEENWFYTKPIIREVFHLQRPPELIDLQGNPNFITKVLVQWKEHPPDQFFSSFYWQVLMLSSLRTRMFSTGEYCYRMISIIRFSYAFIMVCWYNFYLGTINRSVLVRLRLCKACCHFQKT